MTPDSRTERLRKNTQQKQKDRRLEREILELEMKFLTNDLHPWENKS